ncbi:hypothetical protein K1719_030645 [Acacia pycnantha]|nr:hypothetical protein K1719_030645 [Acacia pycnantha]
MPWRICFNRQRALLPITARRRLSSIYIHQKKPNSLSGKWSGLTAIQGLNFLSDKPCSSNYVAQLEACIQSKSLSEGKKIHEHILKHNGYIKDFAILGKLTHLYILCNEIELARQEFDKIPKPSVILWNMMIRAYAWNRPFEKAIDLYYEMLKLGVRPSKFTFPFVIKACSGLQALEIGREIHEHAEKLGLESDIYISTALVDLYAKCGDLFEAQRLFNSMSHRDIVAWNAIIAGFSLHGLYDEMIQRVVQMQEAEIMPNSSTIVAVLPTVGQANALRQGKAIHGYSVRKIFCDNVVVATGLLDMYSKCYHISYARKIFDMISEKNEICWSAMIGGYVICDSMKEAMALYDEMVFKHWMNPTPVTLSSILRACANLTDLVKGKHLHCYTIKSGLDLDTTVGNSLLSIAIVSGCVQNGSADKALLIFRQMQLSGIDPDVATLLIFPFVMPLLTCTQSVEIFILVGKYLTGCRRDIVSWNTMIIGYGIHGLGTEALSLFHEFQASGLRPDDVTLLAVLSACSHSGLVMEGKYWFSAMIQDFNIKPRLAHYICMVDLLARAGYLDEAYTFIQRMPFEPDVCVWGALLAACRIHKNIEMGEEVSKKIQLLGPECTGNFVLMSNIYSSVGRWDDAAHIRIIQRDQGYKKSPGWSWVEVSGVIHGFIGGDQSHPQSASINRKLEELLVQMKKLGYRADYSSSLHDVEEEEKEQNLLYHSEKIAIAFGILNINPNKPIVVTKNLRICVDCHTAIKFITLITEREIVVRDASRFHHFKSGICNCLDFW